MVGSSEVVTTRSEGKSEPQPVREAVYAALRERILRGVYRPNERLVERELARDLDGSRTPVREALLRLQAEGLVVAGRSGLQVREFTFEEIREAYEVRSALEGYAARLAASNATPAELDAIRTMTLQQQERLANEAMGRDDFVAVNDAFHDAVIAAAHNERLSQAVHSNRIYFFNSRLAALYSLDQSLAALDEHLEILATIAHRDGDAAERLVRQHVEAALGVIRAAR